MALYVSNINVLDILESISDQVQVPVISKSTSIDVECFKYQSSALLPTQLANTCVFSNLSMLSTGTARNQVRPICPHAFPCTQQVPRGRSRSHCRSRLFYRSRSHNMSELCCMLTGAVKCLCFLKNMSAFSCI